MNTKKHFLALLCLCASSSLYAHCPANVKEDKVCMMLDGNIVYIYDESLEHNGPYKDLTKASVVNFKNSKSEILEHKKIARGIYKLTANTKLETVTMTVLVDKKQKEIKIKHE